MGTGECTPQLAMATEPDAAAATSARPSSTAFVKIRCVCASVRHSCLALDPRLCFSRLLAIPSSLSLALFYSFRWSLRRYVATTTSASSAFMLQFAEFGVGVWTEKNPLLCTSVVVFSLTGVLQFWLWYWRSEEEGKYGMVFWRWRLLAMYFTGSWRENVELALKELYFDFGIRESECLDDAALIIEVSTAESSAEVKIAVLYAPPEGAMSTSRGFAFRHSMIPRPASSIKRDAEAGSSPKSVIAEMRFISPGSSSSSSIERRSVPEGNHLKAQPRYDRGYSTSDGELSDPDSVLDSTGTSRELGKVGNSGPLESLPETHSLALEASNGTVPAPAGRPKPLTAIKRGDGEPSCRIPLFPSASGLKPSELTAFFVLADLMNDSGRAEHGTTPHSSSALRSDKNNQGRATAVTSTRANGRALPKPASVASAVGGMDRIEPNNECVQTATSYESASERDGKESSSSSTRRYTASESGARRRDPSSRSAFSAELSSSGKPLESGDDTSRRSLGPGAATNFGYSGTPLRFFPGWQGPIKSTHAYSPSPRVDKGPATYNLTQSSSDVGLRHPHRFLSGPILGSMIPKPPPSKWDDADKWIVSPGRKESPIQPHRSLQTLLTGRRNSIAGGQNIRSHHGMGSPDYSIPPGEKPMSPEFQSAFINAGKIDASMHNIYQKKRSKTLSFSDISRNFDPSFAAGKSPPQKVNKEANGQRGTTSAPSSTDAKTKPSINDEPVELTEIPLLAQNVFDRKEAQQVDHPVNKPEVAGSIVNTSSDDFKDGQVPKRPRSVSKESNTVSVAAEPTPLQEPMSCRDMGTQMTPVESLRNSTCTTPGLAGSPTRHCNTPAGRRASSLGAVPAAVDLLELQGFHLAKLELRQLAGGDQPSLDRKTIWTTREEEEMESSASLREDPEDLDRCQLSTKATAWEEAEQTKVLVRFQNKEAKIKAWEVHQKAHAEAEMKKVEAKVEKILADANEKMKDRLASAGKKAAEMRAAAELLRCQQSARTAVRAELVRKAGLLSPSKSSFRSCFRILRS